MSVAKLTTDPAQASYWSKIPGFLERQAKQVREGGWPVLGRKLLVLLPLLLALPAVLVIRLLRPWIIIRFRQMYSDRIGHFAANAEVYLCERDVGINVPQQRFIDVWYYNSPVCNAQLKKMWDRILPIWPAAVTAPIDRLSRLLPGKEVHIIPWRVDQDRDVHNVLARVPPHLSFLPEEEQQGQDGLRALGIPEGTPFVCFHARDSAYLKVINPNFDASYHDYRDSNIHNYLVGVEELTRRGYYAVRMGAVVKEALCVSNPKIIDYATTGHRTDFMDIYLSAKCAFFISSGTGIDSVSDIFRRPIMFINLAPLERVHTWNANHLFIPKKYWLRDERRLMTFREILDSGAGRFLFSEQYQQYGIELIENTPEEIAALAMEMDERLKGTWPAGEEDEELQRRFWLLYKPSELHGKIVSRIGAEFLRQNRALLD